jgi:hypothetical protein
MTGYQGQPRPQSRVLIRAAVACFVVGMVVGGVFSWKLAGKVPGEPVAIDGGTVRLDGEGLTVFASRRVPDPNCKATDESGVDIPLKKPSRSEQWSVGGDIYYIVVHSVNKVPPQAVEVQCVDETSTTYYVGRRQTFGTFLPLGLAAVGSFGFFFVIGTTLIIIDTRRRKRASRDSI